MQRWLSEKLTIAQNAAERLSEIGGVEAVALGGSLARGHGKPDSDIDLGIYYDPEAPPSISKLRRLAADLDDSHTSDSVTDYGGWGPWINGGAHLYISRQRMDWIYRDLRKVRKIIEECEEGRIGRHSQPGHPHGFHTHIYLGEVHNSRILFDPANVLSSLKARLMPYPKRLKESLIRAYSWQAEFAIHVSEKAVARGESSYVAGCFFESVYCLVQVLFALNEQHYVNEKGALEVVQSLEVAPAAFSETAHEILGRPGRNPAELAQSWDRLNLLAEQVAQLTESREPDTHR